MEKLSRLKKIVILIFIIIAIIPLVSITEWACDHYSKYAVENSESSTGNWLLWQVAGIHSMMGRVDKSADTYSLYYETYKLPAEQVDQEDPKVARARFRQAMKYYDRTQPTLETIEMAHMYLSYFLQKYEGTGKIDATTETKAQNYKFQCEELGKGFGNPNLFRANYPAEDGPGYEP